MVQIRLEILVSLKHVRNNCVSYDGFRPLKIFDFILFLELGDKLIEVVGLENCLHMGQVRTGIRSSGKRIAQCSHVIVKVKKRFPMQVDGEPWEQPPGMVSTGFTSLK